MNKKFIIFIFTALLLLESRASADLNEGSGGVNPAPECFEKVSRVIFTFNQALDNVIFE